MGSIIIPNILQGSQSDSLLRVPFLLIEAAAGPHSCYRCNWKEVNAERHKWKQQETVSNMGNKMPKLNLIIPVTNGH